MWVFVYLLYVQNFNIRNLFLLQESPSPRPNGDHASIESRDRDRDSIGLNGDRMDKAGGSNSKPPSERPPSRSGSSSSRSTPSLKTKDVSFSFQ